MNLEDQLRLYASALDISRSAVRRCSRDLYPSSLRDGSAFKSCGTIGACSSWPAYDTLCYEA